MTNKLRQTNAFKPARVELFNQEFCDYNPLFVGQGDAPTYDMAFGLRLVPDEKAVAIDVGCLTGLDLGRVVSKFLGATSRANPDDFDPQISPLTPQARAIVGRVHATLPNATAAYHKQINSAYNSIKTNKLNAAKTLEALSKKGVSPAIAIETFKMIERGVNASQIKNEVIELVAKAVKTKPSAIPQFPIRINDIVNIDTTPEYPSKGAGAPVVSTKEVAQTSALILSDPIIYNSGKSSGTSTANAAVAIAIRQVDQVLSTLASKALLDGSQQPTDSQLDQAAGQQPAPIAVETPKKLTRPSSGLLIAGGVVVGLLVIAKLVK